MLAVYSFPEYEPFFKNEPPIKLPPKLTSVEIYDLQNKRHTFDPEKFSRPNQLDVQKIAPTKAKLEALLKEYRCIKVEPTPSWTDGTIEGGYNPKVFIFRRDALVFNRSIFRTLQHLKTRKPEIPKTDPKKVETS